MHKLAQSWFVLHENWHTALFVIYYFVVVDRIEIILLCKKLRAKLGFIGFLSIFWTFARKVA